MRNTMVKEKGLGIAILAIALVALLVVTACAPPPVAEKKTAEFLWILPITGAASASSQLMVLAGEDYVRYFNEQEVIPGVQIELLWRDTGFQYSLGLSHYERVVAAGIPLIDIEESPLLFGLKDRLARDEVALFTVAGYHELMYPTVGWIYSVTPAMSEQAAVALQYFMENWKEERSPRLVLLGLDAVFGNQSRWASGYARSLGFEVLPTELVPHIVLDATTILLRLKDEGADLVHIQTLPAASMPILRDAERLGLAGQIRFAGHSSTMGEKVIEQAVAASEGYLIPRAYPWFDETEVPGIKLMIDNQMKYHGNVQREGEYFTGWVGAAVSCEAIRRAIENVGYENLDGLAIKEALDGMKDFDVHGLTSITYKPDDHRGTTKMAVYEVRSGKMVRASDWREAPSGHDWEYE